MPKNKSNFHICNVVKINNIRCNSEQREKMNNQIKSLMIWIIAFSLSFISGCASTSPSPETDSTVSQQAIDQKKFSSQGEYEWKQESELSTDNEEIQLPVSFRKPTYSIKDSDNTADLGNLDDDMVIKAGADISTTTSSVPLRDIMKKLASLKEMNLSWASDVDPYVLVDVDIRAEDDFFLAINNLLRQRDYFAEFENNTIIVKFKKTKRFHISIPSRVATTETQVVAVTANVWQDIEANLKKVLDIWEKGTNLTNTKAASGASGQQTVGSALLTGTTPRMTNNAVSAATGSNQAAAPAANTSGSSAPGKGYYMIDKSIGVITVTAPLRLMDKITNYLNGLKKELTRQIIIEAKIVKVNLKEKERNGIDWSDLLGNIQKDSNLKFQVNIGTNGALYPTSGGGVINTVSYSGSNPFTLVLNALRAKGKTTVLSNPKISLMNGQGAYLNVGYKQKYVSKITTTVSEGVPSTSVDTDEAQDGIKFEVVAMIMDDKEIILSLTPTISAIDETSMALQNIGGEYITLPKWDEETMNTIVRIKSGEMLIVGGLIKNTKGNDTTKVPVLGDLPILNKFFSYKADQEQLQEMVIMMKAKIVN
jgi:MSHA type pilus biogenesis protein MshL